MKLTKSYLRKIINEEIDATLEEARMSVKVATEAIANRFDGEALRGLPRAGQRSGTSDDYQYTIRNKVIFSHDTRGPEGETPDQKQERLKEDEELGILARDEAFDALMSEGEPVEEDSYVKRPMILWNGLMLKKMTHSFSHNPGTWLYPAIGVATTKAKSVKAKRHESRGYTDNPDGASGSRSHPKSYHRRPVDRGAESEQDAWRAGGSDLYDKGKEDAQAGRKPTIAREDDNSHSHYAIGYADGRKG